MDKIIIEGKIITNMKEAADWLKEAWMYEPVSISYDEWQDCIVIDDKEIGETDYIDTLEQFLKAI